MRKKTNRTYLQIVNITRKVSWLKTKVAKRIEQDKNYIKVKPKVYKNKNRNNKRRDTNEKLIKRK